MNGRIFTAAAVTAVCLVLATTLTFSKTPATVTQSPDWFLQGSAPDPTGRAVVGPGGRVISTPSPGGGLVAACTDDIAKFCPGQNGFSARACLTENSDRLSAKCKAAVAALPATDGCSRSPVCGNRFDGPRSGLQRVEWKQTMGYTYAYPV
ncbi:MAG TPA: hypothetical protein VH157_08075, partial [Bryobacteraceae bacterium]|nr:hypothetical protein [Bryobacteraceae bacterium]